MSNPQPLLSIGTRLAAAAIVATIVSAASVAAGHESEQAVQIANAAIHAPMHITLPTVTIVARRTAAPAESL